MYILDGVNKSNVLVNNMSYPIVDENSQKNDSLGTIKGIVCHWTAGDYKTFFNGYHVNIGFINNQVVVVRTLDFKQKGQHLWGRNSNMLAITICAMKDWILKPNQYQLDTMSLIIAEVCCWYDLDPTGFLTLPRKQNQNNTLVTLEGNQTFNVISDHREFAIHDGYSSERQDIKEYMLPVRQKAIEYYKELKSGKRRFIFLDIIKN